jgi:hypothetical protein
MPMCLVSLALLESLNTHVCELAHQDGVTVDPWLATAMAEPVAALVTAAQRWQRTTHGSLESTPRQPCAVDIAPVYRDRRVVQLPYTWRTRMGRFHHVLPTLASAKDSHLAITGTLDRLAAGES